MEAPSQLLFRARLGGFIKGFKVGSSGERRGLHHLLFANDTLIFCETNSDQLIYLSWVFMWFEAISGLKVNRDKSKVIPVGSIESLKEGVSVMGCKVGKLPTSYLGLPLGASFKSSRVWDVVEERFRKRLFLWKRQYLSKWGRLTLIKRTLLSLPTYFMSLFVILWKVCARIEKIQRDFLCNLVCANKKEGSLGIHSLVALNKTLLRKWSWIFVEERGSFWKQVTIGKFG